MNTNKFSLLGLLFICSILFTIGQEDARYLTGAVPEVDGRVVFEREIDVDPSVPVAEILGMAEKWVKEEFEGEGKVYEGSRQRLLVVNKDDNYLVVQGDEKLVFKSQVLMIDQTVITYQLIVNVAKGKCNLTVRNIKYEYQDYNDPVPAEEMITDKNALHKSGEKLNRHYDKFRKFTIDRVDAITDSFKTYLDKLSPIEMSQKETSITNRPKVDELKRQESATPSMVIDKTATFATAGYKAMSMEDLSDDIMEMFKDSWVLVTRGNGENALPLPAMWTGKGNFGSKPVVMSIVKGGEERGETYTISFYTQIHKKALDAIARESKCDLTPITSPTGATAFSEAWMIIECKKVLDQQATDEMVKDGQSKKWNIQGFDKLLMGEIVSIWAR